MSTRTPTKPNYPAPSAGRTKSAARALGIVRRERGDDPAAVLAAEQDVAVERVLFHAHRALSSYPNLAGLRPEQVERVVALLTGQAVQS
ncbi:hypothetical protein [Corynebacterium glyciniphilum]|uniref:hypothetical protein n=1 Tax=Corynebacterium glyciniphilum TaxID=1404244 RepID=UPI003FD14070